MVRKLKVKVDGSFLHDTHNGSVGIVIRDCEGKFIATSFLLVSNIASAATMEAMDMREGLSLANHLGCSNIIMELDLVETVKSCSRAKTWWGESTVIFADCVDLAALIDQVSFKHCPREASEVAHEIASNCLPPKINVIGS
jgi:ribonuclease HI